MRVIGFAKPPERRVTVVWYFWIRTNRKLNFFKLDTFYFVFNKDLSKNLTNQRLKFQNN